MFRKEGQSLADYLLVLMPNLQMTTQNMVDPMASRTLFAIWKDDKNKVKDGVYRRPSTVSSYQVDAMTKAGLARANGDNLEITEKGAGVIKVMVLGDDSSIYDKSADKIIDYAQALSNTKRASVRRGRTITKKASADWWERFDK